MHHNILIINDFNYKNFRYGRKIIESEISNIESFDFFGLEY